MGRILWLLSRCAAALTGAFVVGVLAAIIVTVVDRLTCGPACTSIQSTYNGTSRCLAYGSTCGDFASSLLFSMIWAPIFSIALGTVPGIAALTLTPARKHPWRSLPILIVATLVGFAIYLFFQNRLKTQYDIIALLLLPSITGLLVAWNIDRLPRNVRLGTHTI